MTTKASSGVVRHAFGIRALDLVLRGGLPQGSTVLVTGLPGSGKSTLAKQFLLSSVNRGESAVLLSTGESHEIFIESIRSLGLDLRGVEKIRIIDCFSWREGFKNVLDLRKLEDVSSAVDDLLSILQRSAGAALVIDSFTDFLVNNPAGVAVSFLGQLKMRLQMKGVTTLLLMEGGTHDPKLATTIEYLTDGTIQARLDDYGRYLMVRRMLATPIEPRWIPFTLGKSVDAALKDFFGSKNA